MSKEKPPKKHFYTWYLGFGETYCRKKQVDDQGVHKLAFTGEWWSVTCLDCIKKHIKELEDLDKKVKGYGWEPYTKIPQWYIKFIDLMLDGKNATKDQRYAAIQLLESRLLSEQQAVKESK